MRAGCLILLIAVLMGCARHIEDSDGNMAFANQQSSGAPAADAASTMLSPLR